MITFIYAQERNGGIGYQNKLPWHLPNDLQFFKKMTMGHTMLMGRHTFESMNRRLLPGRQSAVITSRQGYGEDIPGLKVIHSLEEAKEMAKEENLMVIGGAGLFLSLFDEADRIIRTVIDEDFPHDVAMPPIDESKWKLVKREEGSLDEKNIYPHHYEWWERKENQNNDH